MPLVGKISVPANRSRILFAVSVNRSIEARSLIHSRRMAPGLSLCPRKRSPRIPVASHLYCEPGEVSSEDYRWLILLSQTKRNHSSLDTYS